MTRTKEFYKSDCQVAEGDGILYVLYGGYKIEYIVLDEWLFSRLKEEGIPTNPLTLNDYTLAHSEEIKEYITENGERQ